MKYLIILVLLFFLGCGNTCPWCGGEIQTYTDSEGNQITAHICTGYGRNN